jgi:hypothetical protein
MIATASMQRHSNLFAYGDRMTRQYFSERRADFRSQAEPIAGRISAV